MSAHRATGVVIQSCPVCGKVGYGTRSDAKRAARAKHPGDHLSPYRCGNLWHIGHLPPGVRDGIVDRSTLKPPKRRRGTW